MTNEELKVKIKELMPAAIVEDGGEHVTISVEAAEWKALSRQLHFEESLHFDFLVFCTCTDWKSHLTMTYFFDSYTHHHNLIVKIKLDAAQPAVETVSDIWPTASFHEREVYELFGVQFIHHPDLRLLILPDGWEGKNPLRKDFEDPVNMIKL